MGEKNYEVKGRPLPIEKAPRKEASEATKKAVGKTAIKGSGKK
jgi:hypothetical protein